MRSALPLGVLDRSVVVVLKLNQTVIGLCSDKRMRSVFSHGVLFT